MFVYPALDVDTNEIYGVHNFKLPDHLGGLFDYMIKTNKVEAIKNYDEELLHISSDEVLKKIQTGIQSWEDDVPESVMKAIKFYHLFGFLEEKFKKLHEVHRRN